MKFKNNLKTVRVSAEETMLVDKFLKQNPAIESFSALARIAILDFIAKRGTINIRPIVEDEPSTPPSFLWDYDLSRAQIREVLNGPTQKRKWLVARILEHARFDEVWKYLTPRDIERDLPYLRLDSRTMEHWAYAIARWRGIK